MKKIYFVLLFFIVSCKGVPSMEPSEPIFQRQEQLTYEVFNSDFDFVSPRQLIVYDSLLVVLDWLKRDDCYHLFKKESGSYVKSFGAIGKAGGELMLPSKLIWYDKDEFFTVDRTSSKIISYNLDSVLLNSYAYFNEFKYSVKDFEEIIGILGKRFIMSSSGDTRFELVEINDSLNTEELYNGYPNVIGEEESWVVNQLFRYDPCIQVSPDKSKMVYLTYVGAVAETFNLVGDSLASRATKCFIYPKIKVVRSWIETVSGETLYGFTNVITTNDYIYALYCGKNDVDYVVNTIYMFDWDLNAITKFSIDIDHLFCISYDSVTGCVYGIGNDEEKNTHIIKFNEKFIK